MAWEDIIKQRIRGNFQSAENRYNDVPYVTKYLGSGLGLTITELMAGDINDMKDWLKKAISELKSKAKDLKVEQVAENVVIPMYQEILDALEKVDMALYTEKAQDIQDARQSGMGMFGR
tara:strand:+ start:31 stop:387 length:357 start_codon:yes stop_codon:yes gene_type:complete